MHTSVDECDSILKQQAIPAVPAPPACSPGVFTHFYPDFEQGAAVPPVFHATPGPFSVSNLSHALLDVSRLSASPA